MVAVMVACHAMPAAAAHGVAHEDGKQALLVFVEGLPERAHCGCKGPELRCMRPGMLCAGFETAHEVMLGLTRGPLLATLLAGHLTHLRPALAHFAPALHALLRHVADRLLDGGEERLLLRREP